MVKVLLILILGQLGFCLSKLVQEDMRKKVPRHINFPFTIRNQFTTSLSSQAAYEMRKEPLNIKETFM
jgi:hypothetical protein